MDNTELVDEDDRLPLSFDHRGENHSLEMGTDGFLYLMEIEPLAEMLKPDAEVDPRRFVSVDINTYVFADPASMKLFADRFGIRLPPR